MLKFKFNKIVTVTFNDVLYWMIQYKREGKQLNFHISRHIAHLGWETPVYFTLKLYVNHTICNIWVYWRFSMNILLILSNEEKRMIMKILKKEWFIWKFWKKGRGSREKGEEETKSIPHAPVNESYKRYSIREKVNNSIFIFRAISLTSVGKPQCILHWNCT
jgi:hypothetical protein